jgi:hypothetical protein
MTISNIIGIEKTKRNRLHKNPRDTHNRARARGGKANVLVISTNGGEPNQRMAMRDQPMIFLPSSKYQKDKCRQ